MAFKYQDLVGSVGLAAKEDKGDCPHPSEHHEDCEGTEDCPPPNTIGHPSDGCHEKPEPCPPPNSEQNPSSGCKKDPGYRQAAELALLRAQLRQTLDQGM